MPPFRAAVAFLFMGALPAVTYAQSVPEPVTVFEVTGGTSSTLDLSWVTPAFEDGSDWPNLHHFLLAVFTAPVTESNFEPGAGIYDDLDSVTVPWISVHGTSFTFPQGRIIYLRPVSYPAAGDGFHYTIDAVTPGTTYYLAMRAVGFHISGAACVGDIGTQVLERPRNDWTAPGRIPDLALTGSGGEFTLRWTAPGDDAAAGTAAVYDLRVYGRPIDSESAFDLATPIEGLPAPLAAGSEQVMTVTGLPPFARYHFAIRARDEDGNAGALSNSVDAEGVVIPEAPGSSSSGGCGGSSGPAGLALPALALLLAPFRRR